jgi:hypothetical protein
MREGQEKCEQCETGRWSSTDNSQCEACSIGRAGNGRLPCYNCTGRGFSRFIGQPSW